MALGPGRDGGRGVPGPLDTAGFRGSADAARQSQGGQAGWDFGFRDALFALFFRPKKATQSHNKSQHVTTSHKNGQFSHMNFWDMMSSTSPHHPK